MTAAASVDDTRMQQPAYARFSRRLRALFIDWAIGAGVLVAALSLAVSVESDGFSRKLGFGVVAALLLYEPLLVWLTGSSVGHYFTNLRVVDEGTQGNVSFFKALSRHLIKTILGWYSLITMATTRRHQALHDLLTHSTVQIRDTAKASSHHYVLERVELSDPGMPSRTKRTMVIIAYLVLLLLVMSASVFALLFSGAVTPACIDHKLCSSNENLLLTLVGLIWFASCLLVIVQGWRGRLLGCRAKQSG
jgi:uncharacterized RDD family membrane protein YckC